MIPSEATAPFGDSANGPVSPAAPCAPPEPLGGRALLSSMADSLGRSAIASAEAAGRAAPAAIAVLSGVLEVPVAGAWTVDDPAQVVVVAVQAGDGEQEVVGGFGRGQVVERDHAGCGDLVHIAGQVALVVGEHLDGQLGGVDEPVAPQAAAAGRGEPGDSVDYADGAVAGDGDLDAGLGGRDQVLVDGGVDPVAGGLAVGGQEDPVAAGEGAARGRVLDPGLDGGELDVGVGAAGAASAWGTEIRALPVSWRFGAA